LSSWQSPSGASELRDEFLIWLVRALEDELAALEPEAGSCLQVEKEVTEGSEDALISARCRDYKSTINVVNMR